MFHTVSIVTITSFIYRAQSVTILQLRQIRGL